MPCVETPTPSPSLRLPNSVTHYYSHSESQGKAVAKDKMALAEQTPLRRKDSIDFLIHLPLSHLQSLHTW